MMLMAVQGFFLTLLIYGVGSLANDIGYFWHISDLHWDPNYADKNGGCRKGLPRVAQLLGPLGDYSCDSPWALIESAMEAMNAINSEDIEFVLWTGDSVTDLLQAEDKFEALKNLTELLFRVFSSQFVFPVIGHTDPNDLTRLSNLWKKWLPTEAITSFKKNGYYMIERKSKRLKVVALNTNLWTDDSNDDDPGGQWLWLENILSKSAKTSETIYLVGHTAPGFDERQGSSKSWRLKKKHNDRYHAMIRKYSDIIVGQFFGHLHSDTFRIMYDEHGTPISNIFLAPSITPKRTTSGSNNPGFRLYTFNSHTGDVLNYMQYFINLTSCNEVNEATWTIEYNFTRYYELDEINPTELNDLVQTFTTEDGMRLFGRYYMANSVLGFNLPSNAAWINAHYCAITQVVEEDYQDCMSTRASALEASKLDPSAGKGNSARNNPNWFIISGLVTILLN